MTENGDTLRYRVEQNERDIRDLKPVKEDVAVIRVKQSAMQEDVRDLGDSVRSLRATIVGFAITAALSAISIALTVLFAVK